MNKPALPLESTDTYNDQVRIVLVETTHSGNIGAVARAMKNMGLGNLWLVNPSSFPDEASYARASSASDVLDRAQVGTRKKNGRESSTGSPAATKTLQTLAETCCTS